MRAGRALIFSSDPQRGELPLPPEVFRVFRTTRPILAPPRRPEQEEQQRLEEQKRQERWGEAEQYRVTVRFGPDPPAPGHRRLEVAARPFRGDARSLYPVPERRYEGFTLQAWASSVIDTAEEGPRRRAWLEQDPVLSVKRPFQPDVRPYADPLFSGAPPRARYLTEFLPELARAYTVNFIADSYWWARKPSGILAGPAPLFEMLDRLAGQQHAWDRRGNLVRFRDWRWFLDRPCEIPLRLVRHWVAVTDRLGALPLAEFASATDTLTDAQIFLLNYGWSVPPQLSDLRDASTRALEKSRYLLRLYARLSPAQRQALWDGKPLALAELSPALRPLVGETLIRIARTEYAGIDLAEWEGGHLTFTRKPDVRIRERRGQAVTFRLESEPAPRATTPPDEVTRFPVTHVEMRIHYGPQQSYALRLIVAGRTLPPE